MSDYIVSSVWKRRLGRYSEAAVVAYSRHRSGTGHVGPTNTTKPLGIFNNNKKKKKKQVFKNFPKVDGSLPNSRRQKSDMKPLPYEELTLLE
jgi:hypothetical protein